MLELLLLAAGLSMDACAVAICKGACMRGPNMKQSAAIGLSFGFFQGIMPLLGWTLGTKLQHLIGRYDHWVAFLLLGILGVRMIREALHDDGELVCTPLDLRELLLLSVATSIDAMAAGLALAVLNVKIFEAAIIIGVITAVFSFVAVSVGVRFGQRFNAKAQIAGGSVLCLIGLRILVQHLGGMA